MTFSAIAASRTVRANGPMLSSDDPNAKSPNRATRPYEGLSPTIPHRLAGCLIDPPVSEPSASGAIPAATATADPPLEPPGMRSVSQGFRAGPYAEFSVEDPIA